MRVVKVEPGGVTNKKHVTYWGLSTEPLPAVTPNIIGSDVYRVDTKETLVGHSDGMWYPYGGGQGIPGDVGDVAPGLTKAQTALVQSKVAEFAAISSADTLNLAITADTHAIDREDTGALDYYCTDRTLTNLYEMVYVGQLYQNLHGIMMLGDNAGVSATNLTKIQALDVFSRLTAPLLRTSIPVMTLRGNHDDNSDSGSTTAIVITPDEYHDVFVAPFSASNGVVHDTARAKSNYFYRDYPLQKIRVVCLDFLDYPWIIASGTTLKYIGGDFRSARPGWGFGPRQVTWLAEEALNFSAKSDAAEWAVTVFAHFVGVCSTDRMASGYYWNGDLVFGVLDAFNRKVAYAGTNADGDWGVSVSVDFSNDTTDGIIAYVVGHQHQDYYIPAGGSINGGTDPWENNNYSFPIVGVMKGSRSVDGSNELVCIDRAAEEIRIKSIIPANAVSAPKFLASRIIPFRELEPSEQYIKLGQGTTTNYGVTLTVEGNHVTLNGMASSSARAFKITRNIVPASSYTTLVSNYSTEEALAVNVEDVVKCVITNQTGIVVNQAGALPAQGLVRPWFSDGTRPADATANTGEGRHDPPGAAAPTDMLAFIAIQPGGEGTSTSSCTYEDYAFDLEFHVNGVKIPVGA